MSDPQGRAEVHEEGVVGMGHLVDDGRPDDDERLLGHRGSGTDREPRQQATQVEQD